MTFEFPVDGAESDHISGPSQKVWNGSSHLARKPREGSVTGKPTHYGVLSTNSSLTLAGDTEYWLASSRTTA